MSLAAWVSGWRVTVIAVVALAAGGLVSLTGSAVASTVGQTEPSMAFQPATEVRHVTPLNAAGHLRARYRVIESRRGRCMTSFFHGRAYRCIGGNFIHDPCWKTASRHAVICLGRPWQREVTRLRVRRLPPPRNNHADLWGLRMRRANIGNCLFATGATDVVRGKRVNYLCRGNWVLVGDPNRRARVWTILTARSVRGRYEVRGRKPIVRAWKPVVRRLPPPPA